MSTSTVGEPITKQEKSRILFVEDEEVVREHLARQLATEYTVETAADGEQALRAVLNHRPDLIITDLVMPSLDGVELVKALRNTPSTATIPILMISGYAPDELRLRGFEGGADAFLAKPYTEYELRIRIRSMLQAAQLRQEEARAQAKKRAEQEAVEERAALLESISDAFYAVDRQWRVIYANQRAIDYFGLRREELLGHELWDAFPVGKGTRIEEEYRRVMRTRQPAAFELISPLSGRWIDIRVYPTTQGIAINFRDITDRKRAEAALRDSELRFRSMADAVPVLMWRADPQNRGTWFNKPWLDFTGRTLEAELGYGWGDIVHPDDRQQALATCQACLEKLVPLEMEFRLRRHDGEYRWMLDRGMPVFDGPDGEFSGYIGTCIDITDRKMAEEAMRVSEERYRRIVESADDFAIITADDKGIITGWNIGAERLTGYGAAEAIGRSGEFLLTAEDRASGVLQREMRTAREAGRAVNERWHIRKDGNRFWASGLLTILESPRPGFLNIFRDRTAEYEAEHQLRELTATLEHRVEAAVAERQAAAEQLAHIQRIETIGQLTGGVAHDFNNLLTPIVGALDILHRKLDEPRLQRLTSGALQAAERARTLVQRLLAFARRQHLEARSVDIRRLLSELSDLLSRTLGPQIEIKTCVDPDLPSAYVDPNQLELALLNLALNARDAMPGGGTLTIEAGSSRIERHLSLEAGEYVRIAVIDNGIGMDEETRQRAIEPFFTTKPAGQGTGLGLSMVHGLVAQSGGDLFLISAPDRGTTATLLLPVAKGPAEPAATETTPAAIETKAGDTQTLTVLLVDDEPLVRMSTGAMLMSAGYTVVEAASAFEALSFVKEGLEASVVITDYAMPGMNGAKLAEQLRAIRPSIPILMITGFAHLSEADVDGLPRLSKPFKENELTSMLARLLESIRS